MTFTRDHRIYVHFILRGPSPPPIGVPLQPIGNASVVRISHLESQRSIIKTRIPHIVKMPAKLTPLSDLRVLRHQIPAHGLTPNTSIQNKPLLIYKSAFAPTVTAGDIEAHLSSVGVVSPQWRYSMYTTSHFHVSRARWSSRLKSQIFRC